MVPLGLLGPLSPEWFKEHKVVGCPHPHVPSGKFTCFRSLSSIYETKSNVNTLCFRSLSSVSGIGNDTDSRNKQWFDLTQVAAAAI